MCLLPAKLGVDRKVTDKRSHYVSTVFRVVCIFFSTLLLLPTPPTTVPCLGLRLKVSQRETAVGTEMQGLK